MPYRAASCKCFVLFCCCPLTEFGKEFTLIFSERPRRLLSEGLLPLQPASYGLHNALRRHELLLRRARCASAHLHVGQHRASLVWGSLWRLVVHMSPSLRCLPLPCALSVACYGGSCCTSDQPDHLAAGACPGTRRRHRAHERGSLSCDVRLGAAKLALPSACAMQARDASEINLRTRSSSGCRAGNFCRVGRFWALGF